MSARNMGSSDQALYVLLTELTQRVRRLERRRAVASEGSGSGDTICDCEDGEDGVGLPAGGTTGQLAAKASNLDYDIEWIDAPEGGGVECGDCFLNDLADVQTDSASEGHSLFYTTASGGFWYSQAPTEPPTEINDLSDVDTDSDEPNVGDHLEWDGANWVPAAAASDLPTLGVVGEFLGKVSSTNYDVDWLKPVPVFADDAARDAHFATPSFGDQCSVEDGTRQFFDGVGWLAWDLDWVDYAPGTHTNITIGNGTETARFLRRGRQCDLTWELIWGSTTSMSTGMQVGLPFNAVFPGGSFGTNRAPHGRASYVDAAPSPTGYRGYCRIETTSTFRALIISASGTYTADVGLSATVPHPWATSDTMFLEITFTMSSPYV